MAEKRVERAYLDIARTLYPDFPPGIPIDCETPDFVWPGRILGVEVKRLFQPPTNTCSNFPPSQIEGFRKKVINAAERLYFQAGGPPVDVTVYFSDQSAVGQNADEVARTVSNFVRANLPPSNRVAYFQIGRRGALLPPGIFSITIAPPLPGPRRNWSGGGVGQTILLTRDLLAKAILEKNENVRAYRSQAVNVWLLIVSDLFPSSMSFGISDEIVKWEFDFSFDKVLLLSREEMKIWPLRRGVVAGR
jgi:hypothetical protein